MALSLILPFGIQPATAIGTVVNRLHRTVVWQMTGLPAAAATLFLVSRMDLPNQTANPRRARGDAGRQDHRQTPHHEIAGEAH